MCRGEETGKVSDLLEINISNIYWHLRHLICCVSGRNKLPGPLKFFPILHHVPVTIWRQRDCISLRENEKSLIKWCAERYHWTFQSFHSLNKTIKKQPGERIGWYSIWPVFVLFCFLPLFPVVVSGYFFYFFLICLLYSTTVVIGFPQNWALWLLWEISLKGCLFLHSLPPKKEEKKLYLQNRTQSVVFNAITLIPQSTSSGILHPHFNGTQKSKETMLTLPRCGYFHFYLSST